MKKGYSIILVLFIALNSYAQQQILVANDGTNATFNVETKKHENKGLTILLTVNWVNEDLEPISNLNSTLVLKKSDISIKANQALVIKELSTENELRFHKQKELHISHKDGELRDLNIEITPSYSPLPNGKSEAFIMAHPKKYTKVFSILAGPQIVITNPDKGTGRGMKRLVENPSVQMKGYISSELPITKFTIDGNTIGLNEKGEFRYDMQMALKGENRVWLTAIDSLENVSSVKLILDYRPPLTEQDLNEIDFYALIIAVEDYHNPMMADLDFPIDDANDLYNILTTKYDFEKDKVIFLKNATNKQIVSSMDSLAYKITDYDNLLIFYAGHGFWDAKTEIGYWLPSDAEMTDKSTWFRNSSLRDHINSIKSNHTLLVADACFSGGIFKTRGAFDNASYAITKLYNMPSRKAMTSGTLKEVPDKSVFLKYLLKRLRENKKTYISAAELFNSFRNAVLNNSPNIPQYGMIQNSGDEGGEFIFIRKQ